jgi:hypothetical protein
MQKMAFLISIVSFHISSVLCTPYPQPNGNPSLRTIYEFPNETWIEYIALRSNDNLLTTLITTPELWERDPFPSKAELVHRFDTVTSFFGIAEVDAISSQLLLVIGVTTTKSSLGLGYLERRSEGSG